MTGHRPSPQAVYTLWIPACANAGWRGAGSASRFMRAHAWWPIPVGEAKFTRGEQIDVLPIPGAPH